MNYPEEVHSQRWKGDWWAPGAGGRRQEGVSAGVFPLVVVVDMLALDAGGGCTAL